MAVQQTSIFAYISIERELNARQREVLQVIEARGPICNLDIAKVLGRPINSITGRTKELVAKELVQESHKARHPITGRTVMMWRAVR